MYDEAGRWLGDYPASGTGTTVQQVIWLDDLPVSVVPYDKPLHYIEPDHLGTPRVVIEQARNVAVWSWDLKGEAFGDTAPNENPDGDGTFFVFDMRFPGQRYDSATGMNYNYFRDYETKTGRYGQSDPIGLKGRVSTYAYAGGNPVSRIDPFGLKDYLACETKAILDSVKAQMTGPLKKATMDAISNHSGWGAFEIGRLDYRIRESTSTFAYGGRVMNAAEFGNYVAGYAGWYYGQSRGLALVMWGGIGYDFDEDYRTRGGPVPQTNTFDFDMDSRGDILAGARRAIDEIESGLATCGCEK